MKNKYSSSAPPIVIQGARMHNLKNINVSIPSRKLVVITGVSGSGKSSLAIDTLFAEGQRRYAESMNAYARQFLVRMEKPDVGNIKGLAPAIAIEQKVSTTSPRSTVGTMTEIYEYIKLLFSKIGKTYSPVSGKEVQKHNIKTVTEYIENLPKNIYFMISFIFDSKKTENKDLSILLQKGFTRIIHHDSIIKIEEILHHKTLSINTCFIMVDRIHTQQLQEKETHSRLHEALEIAFYEGQGTIQLHLPDSVQTFSDAFTLDGISFIPPCLHLFSFNSPLGACPNCEGYGQSLNIDPDLIIPDPNLTIMEDAVALWKGISMGTYKQQLINAGKKSGLPLFIPIKDFTSGQYERLWKGNQYFYGIYDCISRLEKESYKMHYRILLSRYKSKNTCMECKGNRLRKEAYYIQINGKNIGDIINMQSNDLYDWVHNLNLNATEISITNRIIQEIKSRLRTLCDVGLGYLTLNRSAHTLSGGESQRIKLTLSLGSNLTDSIYILDEPSIGLHERDTNRLIKVLQHLKNLGNSVIIIEHDENIMKAADHIIDMGLLAGHLGGEIVAQGTYTDILKSPKSLTGAYLRGEKNTLINKKPRKYKYHITLEGITQNNLKNIRVKIPLGVLCVVTGVSGSGKTSLIKQTLYPALRKKLMNIETQKAKKNFIKLSGNTEQIVQIEMIDQNPIGRNTRSNPVSYIGALEEIRMLFARQPLSVKQGYTAGTFSYNTPGGRCEHCEGTGIEKIKMQFLADIHLTCEVCKGKRYKEAVLEIRYKKKNIADILELGIEEALNFFITEPKIVQRIQPLYDVGLGYMRLGQSASTLSGGEAQRIKLATYLKTEETYPKTLFIFDEPTTGLHFYDIDKLLYALQRLLEKGHSLIVIEHNSMVIKNADWIIELGPDAGDKGGTITFEGTPESLRNR